jgi:hypothetical protein
MASEIQGERRLNSGRIVGGLIMLALGVLMLLDRADMLRGYDPGRLVPGVVLIIIGVAQLIRRSSARRRRYWHDTGGAWLVFIGAWLLVNELHVLGLAFDTSWPLLVIGIGVLMVLRGIFAPEHATGPGPGAGQERD